ncbi:hypothetical protein GCM10009823_31470 [Brevibacterium salitolerans]|uniref:Major Facilitator Superfamily protein n=2 Tax=Brevibacterium salitolerans TaxID=1403566 RepID=A0ABP5ISN4_9MICO
MVLGPNLGVPGGAPSAVTGMTVFAGAFLIAAVCLFLGGLAVFVWLRPDPLTGSGGPGAVKAGNAAEGSVPAAKKAPSARIREAGAELRGNPRARPAALAIVLAQIVMVSIMTMTPVHIAPQADTVTLVGITISLHVLGMYVLAPVVGQVTDRMGHRSAIAIGVLIFFASLLLAVRRPDGTPWIICSLILLGVGWSFAAGPLLALTSFSALGLIAMVFLIPLIVLLAGRAFARLRAEV